MKKGFNRSFSQGFTQNGDCCCWRQSVKLSGVASCESANIRHPIGHTGLPCGAVQSHPTMCVSVCACACVSFAQPRTRETRCLLRGGDVDVIYSHRDVPEVWADPPPPHSGPRLPLFNNYADLGPGNGLQTGSVPGNTPVLASAFRPPPLSSYLTRGRSRP